MRKQANQEPNRTNLPKTFAQAIAQGYQICEESIHEETSHAGGLHRQGIMTVEQLHRETGDVEKIEFPYTATLTVGPARKYRIHRHAYLTPDEKARYFLKKQPKVVEFPGAAS